MTLAPSFLAFIAFILPLCAFYAPLALAPLITITALVAVIAGKFKIFPKSFLLWALPVVLWAWASAGWAISPQEAQASAMALGGLFLTAGLTVSSAWRLDEAGKQKLATSLALGVVFALALVIADVLNGVMLVKTLKSAKNPTSYEALTSFNRGFGVLVLLLWPTAMVFYLRGHRLASIILAGAVLSAVFFMSLAETAMLAAIIGLAAWGVSWLWPRSSLVILRVGMIAAILIMPLAARHLPVEDAASWSWLPRSAHHRLTIWDFAAHRIAEKPILGWGMDAARAIPGAQEERIFTIINPQTGISESWGEPLLPLHTHNAVLQWWLELGAVGVALIGLLLWRLTALIGTIDDPVRRSSLIAVFASGFVISCSSFGAWQAWWLAAMAFGATFAASLPASRLLPQKARP